MHLIKQESSIQNSDISDKLLKSDKNIEGKNFINTNSINSGSISYVATSQKPSQSTQFLAFTSFTNFIKG